MSQIGSGRALQTFCKTQNDPLSYTAVKPAIVCTQYTTSILLATIDYDSNNILSSYCNQQCLSSFKQRSLSSKHPWVVFHMWFVTWKYSFPIYVVDFFYELSFAHLQLLFFSKKCFVTSSSSPPWLKHYLVYQSSLFKQYRFVQCLSFYSCLYNGFLNFYFHIFIMTNTKIRRQWLLIKLN